MMRRIASFRDPKLYAISILAEQLSKSTQPLVPSRVFVAGGGGAGTGNGNGNGHAAGQIDPATGLFGTLISLLVAEKSGFAMTQSDPSLTDMEAFADRVTKKAIATMEKDGQADQK